MIYDLIKAERQMTTSKEREKQYLARKDSKQPKW